MLIAVNNDIDIENSNNLSSFISSFLCLIFWLSCSDGFQTYLLKKFWQSYKINQNILTDVKFWYIMRNKEYYECEDIVFNPMRSSV